MNTEKLENIKDFKNSQENFELIKEEKIDEKEKTKDLFSLCFDLFHLRIQRQRIAFSKGKKYQSHLVPIMKRKIALAKKAKDDHIKLG